MVIILATCRIFLENSKMTQKKFIIYGVPGSGKTTLASRLAIKFDVPHLEADAFRTIAQKSKVPSLVTGSFGALS